MAEKRFQAGKMDRQVIPQRPTETKSGSGQVIDTFEDLPAIWAARTDETGGADEKVEGSKRLTAVSLVTFTIRYRSDITVKWRLVSDGDTFDIQHIAPVGRNHLLAIKCRRHD
ncbi:phage head closure protein [Larkinella humicola]|uniref:Phage head closure protein n=1 Tax=Larkinella humicola TaxID=2607654 RepID=A0A5N1JM12_9BACT|nr:phage head closure protein [Larkinella humicola]KAA9357234.1 phage head closure protein [Larkinella humicola]